MAEHRRHGAASSAPLITSEALDALTPEWAALHALVPGTTVFTHPAWPATWLRHFGRAVSPVFLSIRREEQLIGVASLEIERVLARQLGDHNVTDYAGVLALPGHEAKVAAGVIEWLLEDLTPALELWGVAENSPMRAAFAAGADGFGWSYEEEQEAICPVLTLPADFETYLAGLSKHERHEIRRKLRNLSAAGVVTFESATERADVQAKLDHFLELMRISRDDKDEFLTPQMEAFFRDIAVTFAALGMVRLSTLSLDGVAAAMLFIFENETTTFLYNSGYDPRFAPLAAGLLSKVYAIQDSIARGKQSFDFLRGDEEYKHHLGGQPRQVLRLHVGSESAPRA
jgi:CelD/BcsL family acetyltransferase involved in cellulose biosynthesis